MSNLKPIIYTSKKSYEYLDLYQQLIECLGSADSIKGRYLDLMKLINRKIFSILRFV